MAVRVADIAEHIIARRRLYSSAYEADITRLTREYGAGPVQEALALIEERGRATADHWNSAGHAHAVHVGIKRVLAEREDGDQLASLPAGWR